GYKALVDDLDDTMGGHVGCQKRLGCRRRAELPELLEPPELAEPPRAEPAKPLGLEEELRMHFPGEWAALSSTDSTTLQERALKSQLRLRGLTEAAELHPNGKLDFYVTFLCCG
ncbi:osm1, partial [Symbiodinium pilosum]